MSVSSEKQQFYVMLFEIHCISWSLKTTIKKVMFSDLLNNLKYINLLRSVWEILHSISQIFSNFFLFAIQIYRNSTCNKFYMFQTVVLQSVDLFFPLGARVPQLQCIDLCRSLGCHIHIYWCNDILWNHLKSLETNFCGLWPLDILWGSYLIKN